MNIPFRVDVSPAYDLLLGLWFVAQPPQGQDRWESWARATAATMKPSQRHQLARWFSGVSSAGMACIALVPPITGEHTIPAFLAALEHLPLPDFLRLMVTRGELAVMPPLAASELLALVGHRRAAQEYVDRYIGLAGRERSHLIQLISEPEPARRQLFDLLSDFAETSFAAIEPSLLDERIAAGDRLRERAYALPDAPPEWLHWTGEYSPAVLAPAVLLADSQLAYYHELDRSLFDGMSYEPLISVVGTQRIFAAPGRSRRSGRLRTPAPPSPAPIERWAHLYGALADPSRLRIVRLLLESPRYGGELAALLGMSGATISHHIGELSKAGILQHERRGQRIYLHIQPEAMTALLDESRRYLFTRDTPSNPKAEDIS